MVLLEELDFTLGVSTDGLRETDGDGMKEVEINGGVPLKLATDDRVIGPLNFDKFGNAFASIFFGDL